MMILILFWQIAERLKYNDDRLVSDQIEIKDFQENLERRDFSYITTALLCICLDKMNCRLIENGERQGNDIVMMVI